MASQIKHQEYISIALDRGLMVVAIVITAYAISFNSAAFAHSGFNYCKGAMKGGDGKVKYVGEDVTLGIGKKGSLEVIERVPDPALKVGECKMIEKDKNGKVVKEWKTSPAGQQKPAAPKPGSPTSPQAPKTQNPPSQPSPLSRPVTDPLAKDAKQKKDDMTKSVLYNTPILASFLSSVFSENREQAPSTPRPETIIQRVPVIITNDFVPAKPKGEQIILDTTFKAQDIVDVSTIRPSDLSIQSPEVLVPEPVNTRSTFTPSSVVSTFVPQRYESIDVEMSPDARTFEGDAVSLSPQRAVDESNSTASVYEIEAEMLDGVRASLSDVEQELGRLQQEYSDGTCGVECALALAAEEQRARVLRAAGEMLENADADIVVRPLDITDEIQGTVGQIQLKSGSKDGPVRLATRGAYYMMLYDEEGNAYRCNVHGYCTPTGEFVPVVRKKKSLPLVRGGENELKEERQMLSGLLRALIATDLRYRHSAESPCTLLSSLYGNCNTWMR